MINNQVPSQEAIYSATYVESYLDCVENLPDDLQRQLSRLRELDVLYRGFIRDVEVQTQNFFLNPNIDPDNPQNISKRARVTARVTKSLIAAQEVGDEKLKIQQSLQDVIDNKTRQLDADYKNLDYSNNEPVPEAAKEVVPTAVSPVAAAPTPPQAPLVNSNTNTTSVSLSAGERASKRARRTRTEMLGTDIANNENVLTPEPSPIKPVVVASTSSVNSVQKKGHAGAGKKKKRKSRTNTQTNQRDREDTPPAEEPDPIDPDEPTYCLCDQISFGEMILCDNDLCPIEWFHFSCVTLTTKPKGKWFCPKCRGERPNVMKPKAQFLKELERYNKEKEEKT